MKRKTREKLVFLALLLMWGQVLASPFLVCPQMHGQPVQIERVGIAEPQRDMAMTEHAVPADLHMHMHDHALLAQQPVAESHQVGTESGQRHASAACDQSCQFCRSLNSPDVGGAVNPDHPSHMPWKVFTFDLATALPPPADHFRPPTAV